MLKTNKHTKMKGCKLIASHDEVPPAKALLFTNLITRLPPSSLRETSCHYGCSPMVRYVATTPAWNQLDPSQADPGPPTTSASWGWNLVAGSIHTISQQAYSSTLLSWCIWLIFGQERSNLRTAEIHTCMDVNGGNQWLSLTQMIP